MSAVLKKTLYFAVPAETELNKTLTKNVVLENVSLAPVGGEKGAFNIVNIKLTTDEEEVLAYDFEELEEIMQEKGASYVEEFLKKFSGSYALNNNEVEILTDKFEFDREEKLTAHLNPEQKLVRAALVNFKKTKNLKGAEASFVTNIFDDIVSLKIIDEDTPIGNQKKTINDLFKDRTYLVGLLIHEIEQLQHEVVKYRNNGIMTELTAEEKLALDVKAVWPDWQHMRVEQQKREEEEQALIDAQKKPRGRPRKNVF